jgi:hypothetical protein
VQIATSLDLANARVLRFYEEPSPSRHRTPRIQAQVQDDLVELTGIPFDRFQVVAKAQLYSRPSNSTKVAVTSTGRSRPYLVRCCHRTPPATLVAL